MFEAFYQLFRNIGSEGILAFALLSYTLYIQLGCHRKHLTCLSYVVYSTASFAIFYLTMQNLHLIPYISMAVGQTLPYWFFYLCMIVVSLLWAHICLGGDFFQRLLYVLYFLSLILLYKQLCSPLYQLEASMSHEAYRLWDLATCGFELVLLFFLVKMFHRLKVTTTLEHLPRYFGVTLYFPISFLIGYSVLTSSPEISNRFSVPIVALIILTNLPIVYYLVVSIINAYEEQRNLDAALTQTRAELDQYRINISVQEELRRERHELKNRYFYLQTLLKDRQYQQAEEYLVRQLGKQIDAPGDIHSGNALLDCLISSKIAEAKSRDIRTYTEIVLPEGLKLDQDALCSILSNLLDNAIEASQNEADPDLQILLNCIPGYLTCRISNQVSRDPLAENPELTTTKADKEHHGYGLKVVRETVTRCDGILQLETAGGYFTAKVMLPLAAE